MERRTFVKSLAASLAAAPLLPRMSTAASEQLQSLADAAGTAATPGALWSRVREEFMLNPGLVHLNTGSLGCSPRLVVDAVAGYMHEMEGDPVLNEWGGIGAQMEEVRAKLALFANADKEEIALVRNTTEGMNSVGTGLQFKAGDEVLTTNHEHAGGMICWEYMAKHYGVKIVQLKMPAPVQDKAQILQLVESSLTRRTRVCSFSHVETITGLQMPLADIAQITRPKGILLVCDGAQAPGMLKIDLKALGVDTYATSSHKWMLAPKGTSFLYIRKGVQDQVQPVCLHSGYTGYSASIGTREVPQILGLGLTVDFHNALSRERIEARCRELNAHLRQRLSAIPALRLLTPSQPELSSGIVTYAVDPAVAKNSDLANRLLDEHQVRVKTVPPTYTVASGLPPENYNALRFSTHIFNDEAELDQLADLLAAMLKG